MKTKGARLTTEISLPGRFLVYVPNGEGLGVSRRLDDAERARLKDIIKGLEVEGGRRHRPHRRRRSLRRGRRARPRLPPTPLEDDPGAREGRDRAELVYQEAELPLRIVRDLFAGDFVSAHVDNERTHKRIVGYLKKTSPHMLERVHRYKEKEPLFESYGVEKEIASTLDRRVDLPSGGYLVFDYAEAFTVIDVNTGRFVGSRSKTSTQRLEDTITKNNLEAVKEVVRQLRLRDIGGIIVIDFIDMANPKNRASVEEALRTELERDRTKTYVVEISPLGLVEMTRQNVTDGPREILTRKCPTCAGDGIVVSDQTIAMQLERRLRALAAPGNRVQAYKVARAPADARARSPGPAARGSPRSRRRRAALLPRACRGPRPRRSLRGARGGQARRPAAGRRRSRRARRRGQARRGRAATTRRPAAGKLDGVDVDRRRRGKARRQEGDGRRSAGCSRARRSRARQRRRRPAGPITFESEAEKPTRAPARRKTRARTASTAEASTRRRRRGDEPTTTSSARTRRCRSRRRRSTATPRSTTKTASSGRGDEPTAEPPPKKRTRRGSRGGRRRRSRPAQARTPATDGVTARPSPSDEPAEARCRRRRRARGSRRRRGGEAPSRRRSRNAGRHAAAGGAATDPRAGR